MKIPSSLNRALVVCIAYLGLPSFVFSATRAPTSEIDYFSVRVESATVRQAASSKAPALWTVWKYTPVAAISYRSDWVRIRDFEGDEGWLPRTDLSESPTVCVKTQEAKVRRGPSSNTPVLWVLDRGYSLRILRAKGAWLEVADLDEISGWIKKSEVWGALGHARRSH